MGDSTITALPTTPVVTGPASPPATPAAKAPSAPPPDLSVKPPADKLSGAAKSGTAAPKIDLGTAAPAKADKREWINPHPKGTIFGSYGYNHGHYAKSTIHMTGEGYDFTLHDATARDKPSFGNLEGWAKGVLHTSPDVPQTNYRVGYFVNDRVWVGFSGDHMKYKMNHQNVAITGYVSEAADKNFAGQYNGQSIEVGKPGTILSDLQHCDGLNNVFAEVGYMMPVWQTPKGNVSLEAYAHFGAGGVVTDTRANVFSRTEDGSIDMGENGHENLNGFLSETGDHSHRHTHSGFVLDGFGFSTGVGARATFFKHAFVDAGIKGGVDRLTSFHSHDAGRGAQTIAFLQPNIQVGYQFQIAHKKK